MATTTTRQCWSRSSLALTVPGELDGEDNSEGWPSHGHLDADSDRVVNEITLNPVFDTGFHAAGDAIARIAPPAAPVAADFTFMTGAYPNQLNNVGDQGQLRATCRIPARHRTARSGSTSTRTACSSRDRPRHPTRRET